MLDEIVAQARAEAPDECCGLVGTREGEAVRLLKLRNAAASPLRYEIDPKDQLRAFDELDEAGLDLGIIYHSHTRSAPEPSQTDINLARYPDSLYLIVGVAGPEDDVRLWRITDGHVAETPFDVVEG